MVVVVVVFDLHQLGRGWQGWRSAGSVDNSAGTCRCRCFGGQDLCRSDHGRRRRGARSCHGGVAIVEVRLGFGLGDVKHLGEWVAGGLHRRELCLCQLERGLDRRQLGLKT